VYDDYIVPDSTYALRAIAEGCSVGNAASYSEPESISTSTYGDIIGTYDDSDCPPREDGYVDCWTSPQATANFDDISAVVDKFKNAPKAPAKSRADVCPCSIDWKVDFSDIPCVVDGFRQMDFPCEPPLDPCL
jgi:hypothetical protein